MLRAVALTQYRRVTDGQTERRTDRQTHGIAVASTALLLAMRALRRAVKMGVVYQALHSTPHTKRRPIPNTLQ